MKSPGMTKKSKTTEKSKNHNRAMKFVVIACRVFSPELEILREQSRDELVFEYLPLRAHDEPDTLRSEIQSLINRYDSTDAADAVILAYGLCGNATAGLQAGERSISPSLTVWSSLALKPTSPCPTQSTRSSSTSRSVDVRSSPLRCPAVRPRS